MAITFRDEFVQSNGTNLNAYTPEVGTGWTLSAGTMVNNTNNGTAKTTVAPALYFSDTQAGADSYVEFLYLLPSSGGERGAAVCVKIQDADNWIGIGYHPTQSAIAVIKSDTGVLSVISDNAATTPGQIFKLEAKGGVLKFYADNVQVGSDINETFLQATQTQGLYSSITTGNNWVDYYIAGTIEEGTVPQGTTTIDSVTPAEETATVQFTYTDTDQTGFKYRLDGGSWVDTGTDDPVFVTGLTESTNYDIEMVAYNATGDSVTSNLVNFTTLAAVHPEITTEQIVNNTGELLANETNVTADVYDITDGSLVVRKAGLTTDAQAVLVITDPLLVSTTQYRVVIQLSSGDEGLDRIIAV